MIQLPDILILIIAPLLMLASAFISGSETALFSLSTEQRLRITRGSGVASSAIRALLSETRHLLITLLMSNMLINVLYFVLATVLLLRWKSHISPLAVAGLSVTPLILLIIIGEVMPKLVAARANEQWCKVAALPLLLIHRTIAPIRKVIVALIVTPLARLIAPRTKPAELTPAELEELLRLSESRGVIDSDEEDMLQQVLELSKLKVRHLMQPRVRLHTHCLDHDPANLIETFRQTRLTQVPVYSENIDHIEGIIYARQALLNPPTTTKDVKRLIKQVTFVPEQQSSGDLLVHFRKRGTTLAIVVDEYGGTAGLVTLEDVVEQMVGDIAGPFDHAHADQSKVETVSPGVFRVSGQLAIHDWIDEFESIAHTRLGPRKPRVDTIGGLVMASLGRVAVQGDHVSLGNIQLTVEQMANTRIKTLLIQLLSEPLPDENVQAAPETVTQNQNSFVSSSHPPEDAP